MIYFVLFSLYRTFATMFNDKDFILDEIFGNRLLISVRADQT